MGNSGPSLPRVHPHADSPTMPGLKTCVSDPLDAYCTREQFFDELLSMLREPISPWDLPALKCLEITEQGENECTVKVIFDGESMHDLNLPDKPADWGKDVVRVWMNVKWDRKRYEVNVTSRDGKSAEVTSGVRIMFLKDPFRIEALFTSNKHNLDQGILAAICESQWIHIICISFASRKIKVQRNVTSPYGNGENVCITESLDHILTYDELWEEHIKSMKAVANHVEVINDKQFEVTITNPMLSGSERKPLIRLIRHNKETGEVVDICCTDRLRLHDTKHIKIHRSPVRMEMWTEQDGRRLFLRRNVEMLQLFLDHCVAVKLQPQDGQQAGGEGGGCVLQ